MILSIAHRGASGYEPGNTIRAVKKAIELGADMIEIDVQLTKDRQIVVCHDQKIWIGYKYFSITHNTLENVQNIMLARGERIPTLQEVLDAVSKKSAVNIEIKDKNSAASVNKIIIGYVKKKRWSYKNFIVSSFLLDELKRIKKLNPRIRVGLIFSKPLRNMEKMVVEHKPYSVHLHFVLVDKGLVKRLHEQNVKVFVWTVNSRKLIDKMRSYNVDGIFSDYPDRI